MRVLEIFGICVAALLVLLFAVFFRRRLIAFGGGTIRLQVRVSTLVAGRGWSTGIGQFAGDELRFYRMFSLAIRPKRVLDRATLTVAEQRRPEGPERLTVPSHWVVLRCETGHDESGPAEIEIAMAESTVTGFLSWLEAAPPGQPGQPGPAPRPIIRPRTLEQ
jgi:Protein of unknown function (DUF2550)